MKLTRNQKLESRVRDIKRKLLHQRDKVTRKIWTDYIEYLESQIKECI